MAYAYDYKSDDDYLTQIARTAIPDMVSPSKNETSAPVSTELWGNEDEANFKAWYSSWADRTGINPNPDDPKHYYDYRAAYRAGAYPQPNESGEYHWPYEFKADNHPNRYVDGIDTKTGLPDTRDEDNYLHTLAKSALGLPVEQAPEQAAEQTPGQPSGQPGIQSSEQSEDDYLHMVARAAIGLPAAPPSGVTPPTGQPGAGSPLSSLAQRAADAGIDLFKSVIDWGQSIAGLAKMEPTGIIRKLADSVGYDPDVTNQFLSDLYSQGRKAEEKRVQEAKGFLDTAKALIQNPFVLAGQALEMSVPMIGMIATSRLAAGRAGVSAIKAATANGITDPVQLANIARGASIKAAIWASSISEGLQQVGQNFDQVIREGADIGKAYVSSIMSGAITGGISLASGHLADYLGIAIPEAWVPGRGGYLKRFLGGAFDEAILQEIPQTSQEQMWQNWAIGRPILEGVPNAAAIAGMTAGVMGGAAGAINVPEETHRGKEGKPTVKPTTGAEAEPPLTPTPELIKERFKSGVLTNDDLNTIKEEWKDNPDIIKAVEEIQKTEAAKPKAPSSEVSSEEKPPEAGTETKPEITELFPPQTPEEQKAIEDEIMGQRGEKGKQKTAIDDFAFRMMRGEKLDSKSDIKFYNAHTDEIEAAVKRYLEIARASGRNLSKEVTEQRQLEWNKIAAEEAKAEAEAQKAGRLRSIAEISAQREAENTRKLRSYLRTYFGPRPTEYEQQQANIKIAGEQARAAGIEEIPKPQVTARELSEQEQKQFNAWKNLAENRQYTEAELKEAWDFVQQEAENKAFAEWERKAKAAVPGFVAVKETSSKPQGKAPARFNTGDEAAEHINTTMPDVSIKYDGMQEGFGSIPTKHQFTFYKGPANGATFYVADLTPEAMDKKVGEMVASFTRPKGVPVEPPKIEPKSFMSQVREATKSAPAGMLAEHEAKIPEMGGNITIPHGKRIAVENALFNSIQSNDKSFGGTVRLFQPGNVGEQIFAVDRPYGTLLYNEANGELSAAPSGLTSEMAVKNVKFGVDKTLLLQTISKDIVNNDLATTIANETLQNSIDEFPKDQASKNIDINITSEVDPNGIDETVVEISDNASGMSPKEVEEKLLKLGAKGKAGTTTSGGYGLAKAGFLLTPRRAEVITVKDGTKTILSGTREQFFGVKGAGDLTMNVSSTVEPSGTTFKMNFFRESDEAAKENAFALDKWNIIEAFKRFIANGVLKDGISITLYSPGEGRIKVVTEKPSAFPQRFKKRTVNIGNNKASIYFVKDYSPEKYPAWDGKFYPKTLTYNKGLLLSSIKRGEYGIIGSLERLDWRLIIDFDKTEGVRHINYPFIRNRTELNRGLATKIGNEINAIIKEENEKAFKRKRSDFDIMVNNSPEVNGIKILIPFKNTDEFARAAELIKQNNDMVSDLAGIFKSFQFILNRIGEKGLTFAITVDPGVHGYRSRPEVTGYEFYAINPFAITQSLLANKLIAQLTNAEFDETTAMASNLVHTLVHEYTHNSKRSHNEEFALALANNYVKISHGQLARLEHQARSFYENYGDNLKSLQNDFSGMGKGGSEFSKDSLAVRTTEKIKGSRAGGPGVQEAGEGIKSLATTQTSFNPRFATIENVDDFDEFFSSGPERYVAPAVRAEDGTVVSIDYSKGGHIEAVNKLSSEQQRGKIEDGFITTKGRFLIRPIDEFGDIDSSDLIGKEVPLATTQAPSLFTLNLEDIKSLPFTKRGTVLQHDDGTFSVSFPNNRGFYIQNVTSAGDNIEIQASYGRPAKPGEKISGRYDHNDRTMQIVKGIGDKWTVTHEFQHFLEQSGLLTKDEIDAMERQSVEFNKGKYTGEEGRARWISNELEVREKQRGSVIGKIVQKIVDIIDGFVNLFHQTTGAAVREIESGRAVAREKITNPFTGEALTPVLATTQQELTDRQKTLIAKLYPESQLKAEKESLAASLPPSASKVPTGTYAEQRQQIFGAKRKSTVDKIMDSLNDVRINWRQRIFDRYESIRTKIGNVSYMLHRFIPLTEGMTSSFMREGMLKWDGKAVTLDTSVPGFMTWFTGLGQDGLNLLDWISAKGAEFLETQGREKWLTPERRQQIFEGVGKKPLSADSWETLHKKFNEYNKGILDFSEAAKIIDHDRRLQWEREYYIPSWRVFEDPDTREEYLRGPRYSKRNIDAMIRHLTGADMKLGDPLENVIRNWSHLIHESVCNVARSEAYNKAIDIGLDAIQPVDKSELARIIGSRTKKYWMAYKPGNQKASKIFDTEQEVKDWIGDKKDYVAVPRSDRTTMFGLLNDNRILSFQNGAERVYFRVNDPELYNAMSNMNTVKFDNALLKVFRGAKHILTRGAVFGPAFRIANTIRDSLQTFVVSHELFIPFLDSAKGIAKIIRRDEKYVQMEAAGVAFGSSMHADNPEKLADYIRKILKRQNRTPKGIILDTPRKLLDLWEKVGDASEGAARVMLYDKKLAVKLEQYNKLKETNPAKAEEFKKTMKLEAAFESLDVLDFAMRGDGKAVQFLVQMLPFMNARMQGLYKLGRAAFDVPIENKLFKKAYMPDFQFAVKSAMVGLASLVLWSFNSRRPEWKEIEDWDKWTYYHFWIGGQHYRIPKPFEVGALFSSLWESAAEVIFDNEEAEFLGRFALFTLGDAFEFNPIPQLLRPAVEQWANKSFFTGRPIESESLQGLLPGERFDPWTSKTLRLIGHGLNISPKRMEELVRGYFADYGMGTLWATDIFAYHFGDFPTEPTKELRDYPVVGRFMRGAEDLPPRTTKYVTRFYNTMQEFDELVGTVNHYKNIGDFKKAREFVESDRKLIAAKPELNKVRNELRGLNQIIRRVTNSDMDPDQKRTELNRLAGIRNAKTQQAYEFIQRLKKSGPASNKTELEKVFGPKPPEMNL